MTNLASMLAARIATIRGRFIAARLRTVFIVSLCVSTGIVAAHVPIRWNGGRTGQDADIPLRPLSPAETAALLTGSSDGQPLAGLIELRDHAVVVRTSVYPVVSDHPLGECSRAASFRGITYQICSSSWENYYNVHTVDRASLESALGRTLGPADLNPGFLSEFAPSFASTRLPVYFATEVLFLTTLLTVITWALRRITNPLLVPPLLTGAGVVTAIFVLWYSPAFWDADWFYQRIALEEVIGRRGPLGFAFSVVWVGMVPLTAICLPLYGLTLVVRGMRRLTGWPQGALWLGVTGILLVALGVQFGTEYRRYVAERQRAARAFAQLERAISPQVVEALRSDPALSTRETDFLRSGKLSPAATSAADSLLAATPSGGELRLVIPAADGWFVYLDANPHFRYGDVRQLKSGNTELTDYKVAEFLLRTGEPYEASFWHYMKADYLAGSSFRAQTGLTVVALAGPGWTPMKTFTFRAWWQAFLEMIPFSRDYSPGS